MLTLYIFLPFAKNENKVTNSISRLAKNAVYPNQEGSRIKWTVGISIPNAKQEMILLILDYSGSLNKLIYVILFSVKLNLLL